jgi:CO/xanthine dehydrogenase Mo-binding subunit
VSGAAAYSADVAFPGALWGGYLRSPYAHARILHVDAGAARRLPGVKAIVTGQDVSAKLLGIQLKDKPVYARDRVRYIGEKLAGVAAVDKDTLDEALALIQVEYEELPAVFDPLEAMEPEAPLLHPDFADYSGPYKNSSVRNVRSFQRFTKGDVERGFAESDEIFEATFRTSMVHQAFLEPRAGMIAVDREGRVNLWHCHQAPFLARKNLAEHVDIPEEMIVVHPVSTGGSFGGKLSYDDVVSLYHLTKAAGMPVKVVGSYAEELLDGEPRHATVVKLRAGVKKKEGLLWAWQGQTIYNGGAYGARTPQNAFTGTTMLAGSYRTPHVSMEGMIVYTNQVPCGYFRAPGECQALFAVESQMDVIAEAMGMDPLEFRRRNVLISGDSQPSGRPLRDPRGREVLDRLKKVARWPRRSKAPKPENGVLRGRGLALGNHHIGPGESTAEVLLEPDGTLRLVTAVRDVGVGAYTMHRQVTAEIVGLDPERVKVEIRGTDDSPYDEGVRAQRGIHIEGRAVARAASALVEALRQEAAAFWKVEAERVKWEKGKARLTGKKPLDLKALAKISGDRTIKAIGHCKDNASDVYCFYAAIADVEVDRDTGQVKVPQVHFAIDVTGIINPIIHQGQIDGSVMQGIGYALMEQLAVEDGRVMTLNLGDYKIPTAQDAPRLITSLVQAEAGPGPFGTKAVAECGISIIAPAIANAIYDATGVRLKEIPLAAEKIRAGLDANGKMR